MLPLPSSSSSRRAPQRTFFSSSFSSSSSGSSSNSPRNTISRTLTHLRARTRLTNLAVFLLFLALCLSLLLNFSHYLSPAGPPFPPFSSNSKTNWNPKSKSSKWPSWNSDSSSPSSLTEGWTDHTSLSDLQSGIPLSIQTTITRHPHHTNLNHLIMVPGHAIWLGSPHSPESISKIEEDDEWVLEPMQRGRSVRTFVKHIREGVERARRDEGSLLVFSGGATRPPPSPPTSESQSYLTLASALSLLPPSPISSHPADPLPLNARVTTEEFALDSYENLLFSIARFREVTGRWPERITVVGYGMKRMRFEQLHARAIGWPLAQFEYIGIDDEGDTTEHYAGELKYGFTPFLSSPSGCHPPLSIKRQLRNPFSKYHPYHTSNPDLVELFEWCPRPPVEDVTTAEGMEVFRGWVPWRDGGAQGENGGEKEVVWWDRERD